MAPKAKETKTDGVIGKATKTKKTEEPKKVEEPKTEEEAPKVEAKKEEPKKVEKKEEPKKVEKKEEPKKVEPKKEEAKKADVVMEDAPAPAVEVKEEFVEETDAPADKRPKLKTDAVEWNMTEATLNVMPSMGGKMLMCLNDGGMQYLLAGVRTNTGVQSGRYMFETRIVESLDPLAPEGTVGRAPAPKQFVRVGLSLSGTSNLLDSVESVCFDSDGTFMENRKKKVNIGQKFGRDQVVALMLNLDASSKHNNTVSLFVDGKRASPPQPLPEGLVGKTLFPTVSYRNVSLRVNFGPVPMAPLPFKCRMLQDAATADVDVTKIALPKGGKYEVLFAVGLPDHGLFDWADQFIAKNPSYTEISDRMIIDWATKSGIPRPRTQKRGTNDQPAFNYGLPLLDDMSAQNVINTVSPMLQRNFLVTQLRSNLCKDERAVVAKRFKGFKKVAMVVVGEPTKEYKAKVQQQALADKVTRVELERKKQKGVDERNRLLDEKRKKADQAKKAREAAERKKKAAAAGEEEPVEEDEPVEEVQEEVKADDGPIELTEEEKKVWHRKNEIPDLTEDVIGASFGKFSFPTKEEGFDEIRFEWAKEAEAEKIVRDYVLVLKRTSKVHNLPLTTWFKEQWTAWQKSLSSWKVAQRLWKDPAKRKALQDKKRAEKKEADKKEAGEGEEEKKDEEPDAMEIDTEEIDPLTCESILDLGNGEPLFANYTAEDWAILSIAYELHLCVHSFRKALDDPDRASFTEKDLAFYYNLHYGKTFNLKNYATPSWEEFKDFVKESVKLNKEEYLEVVQPEDAEQSKFVRLVEEQRRERERRVDAGDETAKIKFPPPQSAVGPPRPPAVGPGPSAMVVGQKRAAPGPPLGAPVAKGLKGGGPAAYGTTPRRA